MPNQAKLQDGLIELKSILERACSLGDDLQVYADSEGFTAFRGMSKHLASISSFIDDESISGSIPSLMGARMRPLPFRVLNAGIPSCPQCHGKGYEIGMMGGEPDPMWYRCSRCDWRYTETDGLSAEEVDA